MSVIKTNTITKHFKTVTAVNNLAITVPEGSIYGFLGPNGAGKTTTIKMLTGFLKPDQGDFEIMGKKVDFGDTGYMKDIGFLPDVPSYYKYMTGREFLEMCAHFQKSNTSMIPELLKKTGLTKAGGRKLGAYSRGMKQRLGIAQALVNDPKILILDEPVSALDPMGRKDVLDMLAALKGSKTIFFSTHILSDVERICDHAAIINEGKLVLEGSIDEIAGLGGKGRIILEVDSDSERLAESIAGASCVLDFTHEGNTYSISPTEKAAAGREIPQLLAASGVSLIKYEQSEPTLEDIFVKVVNG